jgi:hypothetical protein
MIKRLRETREVSGFFRKLREVGGDKKDIEDTSLFKKKERRRSS